MVNNERISELLPLEERIRRMGGERSYAIGIAIGEAVARIARGVSSRARAARAEAPSLGHRVAAGD